MTTTAPINIAYALGWDAGQSGARRTENPYARWGEHPDHPEVLDRARFDAWADGWGRSRAERRGDV